MYNNIFEFIYWKRFLNEFETKFVSLDTLVKILVPWALPELSSGRLLQPKQKQQRGDDGEMVVGEP